VALPVERRLPLALLHRGESGREPELRACIPAVLDEGEVLPVRDHAGREPVGLEEHAMPWPLVVECEAHSLVSDPLNPAVEVAPFEGRRACGWYGGDRPEGGTQRVGPQHVLDV